MDTSQQYIIMCEEAQEIQQRPMTGPDMFYAQKWMNRTKETDYRDFNSSQSYYHDIEVELSEEKKALWKDKDRYMQKVIWLPRQDQLQQMRIGDDMNRKPITLINILMAYKHKIVGEWEKDQMNFKMKFTTLEQVWLSIIMEEIYNKQWDIETKKWIPASETKKW